MANVRPFVTRTAGPLSLDKGEGRFYGEYYRRILAVNETAVRLGAAGGLSEVLVCLAECFDRWMPEHSCALSVAEGGRYRRMTVSGSKMPGQDGLHPLSHGIAGEVFRTGGPAWHPDLWQESGSVPRRDTSGALRSVLALPLGEGEKLFGVLEISSLLPNHMRVQDHHFSLMLAGHLAAALMNLETRQTLQSSKTLLAAQDRNLMNLTRRLRERNQTDDLTGLFNKPRLMKRLLSEIARVHRYGRNLCCLMIDVDDFKQINDSFGHQAGDTVLQKIARLLQQSLRSSDFTARFGGEEFAVLLPETDAVGGFCVAQKLCTRVRSVSFLPPPHHLFLRISIGVAACRPQDRVDAHELLLRADSALYRAKHEGKDRACVWNEQAASNGIVKNLAGLWNRLDTQDRASSRYSRVSA